jgi:hypothetical protein
MNVAESLRDSASTCGATRPQTCDSITDVGLTYKNKAITDALERASYQPTLAMTFQGESR